MTDSTDRRGATREQRIRLGEAIRRARGRVTQKELGEMIGEAQTTLSRWEGGEVDLGIGQALRIERALGLPPGWIALTAGLVDIDGLAQVDPDDLIRIGFFDSFDDVTVELAAAATLGLGVRLSNRMVPSDFDGAVAEEWVMFLCGSPEEKSE